MTYNFILAKSQVNFWLEKTYFLIRNLIHQGLEAEANSCKQVDKDARNDDTCA